MRVFCGGARLMWIGLLLVSGGFLSPARSAQQASAKLYVAEFQQNSVGVIDSRDNSVIKHIPIPKGAHGVAILPDGSKVFVSSDESGVISVIDPRTDEVTGTIRTGKQPHGLVASADSRHVYAAIFGDDQILEIDAHTLKVVRTFDAPQPHNLALSRDGKTLFVAAQKPGNTGIARIDVSAGVIKEMVPTATVPRSLGLSPDGTLLCATLFDRNDVDIYTSAPLTKTASVTVGTAPHHVTFTPDGKLILVVNQVTNDLTMINPKTQAVVATVPVGKKPHWIAPTADSKYAYVSDESSNEVLLVDLEDKDIEKVITVGGGPRKIALQMSALPSESRASTERTGTAMSAQRVMVSMQGPPPRFVPETITIESGTTVEWVNNGKNVHTVTDDAGDWDSGSLSPGEKYAHLFSDKGTYHYHCIPHDAMGMVGTIIVK